MNQEKKTYELSCEMAAAMAIPTEKAELAIKCVLNIRPGTKEAGSNFLQNIKNLNLFPIGLTSDFLKSIINEKHRQETEIMEREVLAMRELTEREKRMGYWEFRNHIGYSASNKDLIIEFLSKS